MKTITSLLAMLLICGCTQNHQSGDSPRYVHVVMLWLKNPGNAADRQTLIEGSQQFVGKMPGLISVESGPVQPSPRPENDSSYDVGVVMYFDSAEAMAKYPEHPVHVKATKEILAPLVDHLKVYEFVETKIKTGRPDKGIPILSSY